MPPRPRPPPFAVQVPALATGSGGRGRPDATTARGRRAGSRGSLGLVLFLAACGEPTRDDSAPSPLLDDTHEGWRDPRCWRCHDPEGTHHPEADPWECAACHGSNGAPSGHTASTPCGDCHGTPHGGEGFPDPEACETCHPR